jgi:MFS family permease
VVFAADVGSAQGRERRHRGSRIRRGAAELRRIAVGGGSSAACGLAPDLAVLIGARLVQGVGAAAMMPASLTLIREAYTDPVARGRAIA